MAKPHRNRGDFRKHKHSTHNSGSHSFKIGICTHAFCKKKTKVEKCIYCGEWFCREHIQPKMPRVIGSRSDDVNDSSGLTGHTCSQYYDNRTVEQEAKNIVYADNLRHIASTGPVEKKKHEFFKHKKSFHHESTPDFHRHFEEERKPEHHHSEKRRHNPLFGKIKYFLRRHYKWILYPILIVLFLFAMTKVRTDSPLGKIFDWVMFLVALYFVLKGTWSLAKKLDRLDLSSDLYCWGLRILGALLIFLGFVLFLSTSMAVMLTKAHLVFNNILWIIALCIFLLGCFMEYRSVRRHPALMVWGPGR